MPMTLKTRFAVALIACCAGLMSFAAQPAALERSATVNKDSRQLDTAAGIQFDTLKSWATALIQGQQTIINNILDCGKKGEFWNGSVCIPPPAVVMENPTVNMTTRDVTEWQPYRREYCCKKVFGSCVRNKHDHLITVCSTPAGASYTFDKAKNSIDIVSTVCTPGKVQWRC